MEQLSEYKCLGRKEQEKDGACGPSQEGFQYSLTFLKREWETIGRGS